MIRVAYAWKIVKGGAPIGSYVPKAVSRDVLRG